MMMTEPLYYLALACITARVINVNGPFRTPKSINQSLNEMGCPTRKMNIKGSSETLYGLTKKQVWELLEIPAHIEDLPILPDGRLDQVSLILPKNNSLNEMAQQRLNELHECQALVQRMTSEREEWENERLKMTDKLREFSQNLKTCKESLERSERLNDQQASLIENMPDPGSVTAAIRHTLSLLQNLAGTKRVLAEMDNRVKDLEEKVEELEEGTVLNLPQEDLPEEEEEEEETAPRLLDGEAVSRSLGELLSKCLPDEPGGTSFPQK